MLTAGATGSTLWLRHQNMSQYALRPGLKFPELTLRDAGDHPHLFTGESQQGRHIVLYVRTTCGHCSAELSGLQDSIHALSDKNNHDIPAVVLVDPDGVDKAGLDEFLRQVPSQIPVLIDTQEQLKSRYPALRVPTTFFVLGSGVVDHTIVGERTSDYLLNQIHRFVNDQN
jgi:peroxiredoxin